MRLKRRVELRRWTIIVFDGVSGADDLGLLETRDGMDKFVLDFERQAGGKTVHVIFPRMPAFRLEEELMAALFRQTLRPYLRSTDNNGDRFLRFGPYTSAICPGWRG